MNNVQLRINDETMKKLLIVTSVMNADQATARRRKESAIAQTQKRWQQAQALAHKASDFLKQEYNMVK